MSFKGPRYVAAVVDVRPRLICARVPDANTVGMGQISHQI